MCRNLVTLAKELPVPLIVENLDYNPGGAYEHIYHPDFITDIVEESNVGFLLDLAHAQVSAAHLGYSITDYIGALPLNRVMQLHVSGPRWHDGMLRDAHEPMREEDYALLIKTLGVTTPCAVTLEYFRDEVLLSEQIKRLRPVLELTITHKSVFDRFWQSCPPHLAVNEISKPQHMAVYQDVGNSQVLEAFNGNL